MHKSTVLDQQHIRQLLAETVDHQEDKEYGVDHGGDESPKGLARREGHLQHIQQAQKALEGEAKATAEQAQREREGCCEKNNKAKRGGRLKSVCDIPADNKQ